MGVSSPILTQSVLLVCLSNGWGTQEKAIWRDLESLRSAGLTVGIVCTRNSFLYQQAIKDKHLVFPYNGETFSRFFDSKFYFFVKKILEKTSFQIIKTYNPKSIYSLSYILRKYPENALILGLYKEELPGRKSFFDKVFHARVDEVLVPSSDLIPYVARSMAVGQGRINVVPLGIVGGDEWENWKKKYPPSKFVVGTLLSADSEEIDVVEGAFDSIKAVESWVGEHYSNTTLEFWVFSERPWRERIVFEELNQKLWEKNLTSVVILKDLEMGSEAKAMNSCDVWVCLERNVPIGHDALLALVQGIPSIHIRTSAAAQLARRPQSLLGTFALGNSRELRQKIIDAFNKLKQAGPHHAFSVAIRAEHAPQHYTEELLKHFNRALTRRARALSGHHS